MLDREVIKKYNLRYGYKSQLHPGALFVSMAAGKDRSQLEQDFEIFSETAIGDDFIALTIFPNNKQKYPL